MIKNGKNGCPGAARVKGTPEIIEKICPECGREIEMFTSDAYAQCECGFIAYNDAQSCIKWCKFAEECVGEEIYEQFMKSAETATAGK